MVAIPLGEGDDPAVTAKTLTERLDGTDGVSNLRLGEATYATTKLGVRAALIDAVSYVNGGLAPRDPA